MQVPRAKNSKLRTGFVVSVDRFLDRPSALPKPKRASSALRSPYRSHHNPRPAPLQAAEELRSYAGIRLAWLLKLQLSTLFSPVVQLTHRPSWPFPLWELTHTVSVAPKPSGIHQRIRSNNPCHSMDSSCRLTHHAVAIENSSRDADWPEMAILPSSGARTRDMESERELHIKQSASTTIQPTLTAVVCIVQCEDMYP